MIDLNIDQDYYKVLGIKRSALTQQIQKAYKDKYHQPPADQMSNIKSLKSYFIDLDRALEILTNINKRSAFDAHWTYNFLKKYAWNDQLLSEKDYKYLERFWARQHLNREIYASLNFDNFTPEYDLKWYVPFYQESFWKDVEKKEETYTPSLYSSYKNRLVFSTLTLISFFGVAFSIFFMNSLGTILFASLLTVFILLIFWSIKKFLKDWRFANEDKTLETAQIVDKWVKLEPRFFSAKYKPIYFVAYKTDNGIFYQRVSQNVFNRLKTESPVDIVVSINNPSKTMLSKTLLDFLEKKTKQEK